MPSVSGDRFNAFGPFAGALGSALGVCARASPKLGALGCFFKATTFIVSSL
ncbi:MAG: hypothetical protein QME75_14510 [Deltaproteobacteria bacterium]|nr:hypothetical protein [Deltaproteobacteria bacterium]